MIKPLLRVLPSLSGNVKLACSLSDQHPTTSDNKNWEANIRSARILPLSSQLWEKNIPANLLASSWEYDLKEFYKSYSNIFYKDCFEYNKDDMLKLDRVNEQYVRAVDFEYGCKRTSYQKNNEQFAFFAPIYIDNADDIPAYFQIEAIIQNVNTAGKVVYAVKKTIRVNIGINGETKQNYIYRYLKKYLDKIDNNVAFCLPLTNQATYYGIDLQHGGFVTAIDNMMERIYRKQNTILNVDATICQGFERNKIAMKQILPLCIHFDINDFLTDAEKLRYRNSLVSFSGAYYDKADKKLLMHDFITDYVEYAEDFMQMNPYSGSLEWSNGAEKNIMNVGFPSLNDYRYIKYQYTNKLAPWMCHWKLKYSDDEHPYTINNSWAYSKNQNSNNRYGQFPSKFNQIISILNYIQFNNGHWFNMVFPLGDREQYKSGRNIYTYGPDWKLDQETSLTMPGQYQYLVDKYRYIIEQYCANWFSNVPHFDWGIFNDNAIWRDVDKDGCVYYNGILYDLKNVYYLAEHETPVDKFAVILCPVMDIFTRDTISILKFARYTLYRRGVSSISNSNVTTHSSFIEDSREKTASNYIWENTEYGHSGDTDLLTFDDIYVDAEGNEGNFIDMMNATYWTTDANGEASYGKYDLDYYRLNRYYLSSDIDRISQIIETETVEAWKEEDDYMRNMLSAYVLPHYGVPATAYQMSYSYYTYTIYNGASGEIEYPTDPIYYNEISYNAIRDWFTTYAYTGRTDRIGSYYSYFFATYSNFWPHCNRYHTISELVDKASVGNTGYLWMPTTFACLLTYDPVPFNNYESIEKWESYNMIDKYYDAAYADLFPWSFDNSYVLYSYVYNSKILAVDPNVADRQYAYVDGKYVDAYDKAETVSSLLDIYAEHAYYRTRETNHNVMDAFAENYEYRSYMIPGHDRGYSGKKLEFENDGHNHITYGSQIYYKASFINSYELPYINDNFDAWHCLIHDMAIAYAYGYNGYIHFKSLAYSYIYDVITQSYTYTYSYDQVLDRALVMNWRNLINPDYVDGCLCEGCYMPPVEETEGETENLIQNYMIPGGAGLVPWPRPEQPEEPETPEEEETEQEEFTYSKICVKNDWTRHYLAPYTYPGAYWAGRIADWKHRLSERITQKINDLAISYNLNEYEFVPVTEQLGIEYAHNTFNERSSWTGHFYGDAIPQSKIEQDLDVVWVDPYNFRAIFAYEHEWFGHPDPFAYDEETGERIDSELIDSIYKKDMYVRFLNKQHIFYWYVELHKDLDRAWYWSEHDQDAYNAYYKEWAPAAYSYIASYFSDIQHDYNVSIDDLVDANGKSFKDTYTCLICEQFEAAFQDNGYNYNSYFIRENWFKYLYVVERRQVFDPAYVDVPQFKTIYTPLAKFLEFPEYYRRLPFDDLAYEYGYAANDKYRSFSKFYNLLKYHQYEGMYTLPGLIDERMYPYMNLKLTTEWSVPGYVGYIGAQHDWVTDELTGLLRPRVDEEENPIEWKDWNANREETASVVTEQKHPVQELAVYGHRYDRYAYSYLNMFEEPEGAYEPVYFELAFKKEMWRVNSEIWYDSHMDENEDRYRDIYFYRLRTMPEYDKMQCSYDKKIEMITDMSYIHNDLTYIWSYTFIDVKTEDAIDVNTQEVINSYTTYDWGHSYYFTKVEEGDTYSFRVLGDDGAYSYYAYTPKVLTDNPWSYIQQCDSMLVPLFNDIFVQPQDEAVIYVQYSLGDISEAKVISDQPDPKTGEYEQLDTNYRYNKNDKVMMVEVSDEEKEQFHFTKTFNRYSNSYSSLDVVCDDLKYGDYKLSSYIGPDGTKYGFYWINSHISNTSDTFKMLGFMDDGQVVPGVKYVDYINTVNIVDKPEYISSIFKQILPFISHQPLTAMTGINTIVYPQPYTFDIIYTQHIHNYNNLSDETDIVKQHEKVRSMSLIRYFHAMNPVIIPTTTIQNEWRLKLKNSKAQMLDTGLYTSIGDSAIYSQRVHIENFEPWNVYAPVTNKEIGIKSYNNVVAKYTPLEYKFYNDSKAFNLEPHFTIKVPGSHLYAKLHEFETDEYVRNIFSRRLNGNTYGTAQQRFTSDEILFLLNKYKVSFNSTSIGLNPQRTEKMYTLSVVFDLA